MIDEKTSLTSIQLNQAIELLTEEFSPQLIYLFGSAARKELRSDSDIDLAFWSERSPGNSALL
jgi:predicted nucleotidyltransferase